MRPQAPLKDERISSRLALVVKRELGLPTRRESAKFQSRSKSWETPLKDVPLLWSLDGFGACSYKHCAPLELKMVRDVTSDAEVALTLNSVNYRTNPMPPSVCLVAAAIYPKNEKKWRKGSWDPFRPKEDLIKNTRMKARFRDCLKIRKKVREMATMAISASGRGDTKLLNE